MRVPVFLLLAACGAAFAQDPGGNAAAEAARKRIATLNLFAPLRADGKPIVVLRRAEPVCAIPLTNVLRRASGAGPMPVLKPGPARKGDVIVPIPACDEGPGQNK